jgi:hypothetical protein
VDVLIVLVFVSLVLVAAAVLLFVVSLRQRDFEHSERLSLLPLRDVDGASTRVEPRAKHAVDANTTGSRPAPDRS